MTIIPCFRGLQQTLHKDPHVHDVSKRWMCSLASSELSGSASKVRHFNRDISAQAAITYAVLCRITGRQMCLDRPRIEECLPGDALEAIMGHLDRETLCTARLVSKTFCAAASAHVCSLTLASTSESVSFHRYPHVQHVIVRHVYLNPPDTLHHEDSLARLNPGIRDLTTALTIGDGTTSIGPARDFLSQAALMPKLQGLDVKGYLSEGDEYHQGALLARCTRLEAIRFCRCSLSVAEAIVTMTRLTSLDIGYVLKDEGNVDVSWLGHATNLRSLQALRTWMSKGALPLIGNLTGLTGLTVSGGEEETDSIAPLTRLSRLRSLCIDWGIGDSNLGIAGSLGSGSLVNLDLRGDYEEASADCGRMLSHQTALTRSSQHGQQLCDLRHLGALRIELLQCLEINDAEGLDAEGLSVLFRATSLTKLRICIFRRQPQMGLSQVLPRLTHLQSLCLKCWQKNVTMFLDFPRAFSPMTALTELRIHSHALHDGALRALLVLTGLRVLELGCSLTDDVLPELGLLTNLHTLSLRNRGFTSVAPVREVLDPLRKARGLPPLHTECFV